MTASTRVASLPMYFHKDHLVDDFWGELAGLLRQGGIKTVPQSLCWPDDLLAHWLSPHLQLSQACGYPLVTQLKSQVQVLGTFRYAVPGSQGIACKSQIVVRQADASASLQSFAGRTVAYNGSDSQSGYSSLRALIAPLAQERQFFGARVETGAHRASIDAVREGKADLAAIDCVTFAGVARDQPEKLQGLVVWGETAAYPGLPLITSASTSPQEVAILRKALSHISSDERYRPVCEPLFIQGFEALTFQDYQRCTDIREQALALGVEAL